MKFKNQLVFLLGFYLTFSLICLSPSLSQASARFSMVGAGTYTKPVVSSWPATYKAKIGFGGGLQTELQLSSRLGLEIGALFLQRSTDETLNALINTTVLPYVEVPVMFRLWLNPTLSFGAGGYFAKGAGKIKSGSTSISFTSFGIKSNDYGVIGSVGLNIKLKGSTSLIIDGRYGLGLSNTSLLSGASFKNSEIYGLVGLSFGGKNK